MDYLLKPIRFDRFLRAVNKAFPSEQQEEHLAQLPAETKFAPPFIYLKVEKKMVKVLLDSILYIESDEDYLRVFTTSEAIITRQTISSIEAMLAEKKFMRIHRSFIISLDKIKSFTPDVVEIGNKELPVGKLYRNAFLKVNGEG